MSANQYAGTCATCHERVAAGQGYYDGNLWCAEPVEYDAFTTMCPTAARWQEVIDRKNAQRRATQVAPEPTPEEIARREFYIARREAWEAEGKRECGRCGGNGGSQAWPGFVCYGCDGRGYTEVAA
jgi:DnaJ-class molecular chaperone